MKRVLLTVAAAVLLAAMVAAVLPQIGSAAPTAVPWEARLAELEARLTTVESELSTAKSTIATLTSELADAKAAIADIDVTGLSGRVTVIEANKALKLGPYVDVKDPEEELKGLTGPHILFTGANVHVQSGSDATDDNGTLSGLGNLIVGYNQASYETRTGSHNLVVGDFHSFSSYGGFVAGRNNDISERYASVSGGLANIASGSGASVSGGAFNVASGEAASVSGGHGNTASGSGASVSGGEANVASNVQASVSGGYLNTASGEAASVSGGREREATDWFDWSAGHYFSEY